MEEEKPARFASVSYEELNEKRKNINSKNTIAANVKAAKMLRDYLLEKDMDPKFEQSTNKDLNNVLVFFYVNARKINGEKYKVTSLENFRHSLNRYLQAPPYNRKIDVIKDPEFRDANQSYRSAIKELKAEGKGTIDHHPEINEKDLKTLYQSIHMSPSTPCGLQHKVQFDIRLYFCRRGAENMHSMTKSTFTVKTQKLVVDMFAKL